MGLDVAGSKLWLDRAHSSRWPIDRDTYMDDPIRVVVPAYLSAGDYSSTDGGLVRANYNVFVEEYAALEGSAWWRISGSHGSFGVAVRDDLLDYAKEQDEDYQTAALALAEALAGLDNYPYLDGAEDEESHLKIDRESMDWTEYGGAEFLRALEKALGFDHADMDPPLTWNMEAAMWQIYSGLADSFSVYPEVEGSGDNLATVFQFDYWFEKFNAAIAPWNMPDGTNPLAEEIVGHIAASIGRGDPGGNDGLDEVFGYGKPLYNVIAFTRANTRTPDAVEVFRDWVLDRGPEQALARASQRNAAFSDFSDTKGDARALMRDALAWARGQMRLGRTVPQLMKMVKQDARSVTGPAREVILARTRIAFYLQDHSPDEIEAEISRAFSGLIPGGRPEADLPDSMFDPEQLRIGIEVEMEHTSDRRVAKEIVKAHLTERADYYKLLRKMEKAPRDPTDPFPDGPYIQLSSGRWVRRRMTPR